MAYKTISFEYCGKKMMEICGPLFEELKVEDGAVLFQVFKDGSGSGAFLPREPYKKINAVLKRMRQTDNQEIESGSS